jgi:hypothetical protein
MSRKFSKELEDKINSNLVTGKTKKKGAGASAKPASTKPAANSAFPEERIFVKCDIPARAVNQLFKAAGLPPSDGTRITAKVSTFNSNITITFRATVYSEFARFPNAGSCPI